MARQTTSVEINTFVRGLITEASPLTFPENASIAEENFRLKRDGSRERRLGMDFEENYVIRNTSESATEGGEPIALTSFKWQNAGGDPNKELLAVQTGRNLRFFDFDSDVLSAAYLGQHTIGSADRVTPFSYAVVDGTLVVASGSPSINFFEFNGSQITRTTRRLLIRDFFGVAATFQDKNLLDTQNIGIRPTFLSQAHRYNLRNQSWALPRERDDDSRDIRDPIRRFADVHGSDLGETRYPSNADSVNQALYADPSDENNRTGDQFHARDLINNPVGSFRAASGYFVIDALNRGASRLEASQALYEENQSLQFPISSLPEDRTPGGARVVSEFAGRVWYGGFRGDVIGGDSQSPRMSSYLLYSRLVNSPSDINRCYQEGDPTSKEAPDLVDTDGGFLRIDGAYDIQRMVSIGAALLVFARNGIWQVSGGSDYGFTANNIRVSKIDDRGIEAPNTAVQVDKSVLFWADDGIYHVKTNEFGDWISENITKNTIQSFYDEIPSIDKYFCQGVYDSYEDKVFWVYRNRINDSRNSRELVLDVQLGAFYVNEIKTGSGTFLPKVVLPIITPAFREVTYQQVVTVGGDPVTVNSGNVFITSQGRGQGLKETLYLTITSTNTISFTFSNYRDVGFRDWRSLDNVGVDAPAFLLTGWTGGGDFLRYKQVPYVAFHFNRTEDGFLNDGTGNLIPTNESSCIVQAQWDWANSANSNRWGREFEAYRYKRLYSPENAGDPFDNGHGVITTRNKLRGKGRVISLYIRTSPDKDCQLLGWSMLMGVTGGV